jgi:hypothetical protein
MQIGTKYFTSQTSLRTDLRVRCTRILFENQANTAISDGSNDEKMFLDVLGGHLDVREKIGPGVDHLEVRRNQINRNSGELWVIRTDGTSSSWSYVKASKSRFVNTNPLRLTAAHKLDQHLPHSSTMHSIVARESIITGSVIPIQGTSYSGFSDNDPEHSFDPWGEEEEHVIHGVKSSTKGEVEPTCKIEKGKRICYVNIKQANGSLTKVRGPFFVSGLEWTATVEVNYMAVGTASAVSVAYTLNKDVVIGSLLDKCITVPHKIKMLLEVNDVKIENIVDLLSTFGVHNLSQQLKNSPAYQFALAGAKYPLILKYGPDLFPSDIVPILLDQRELNRQRLETILENEPWKVCFRGFLGHNARLGSLEASLTAYNKLGLYKGTPAVYIDCIYVYDALKTQSARHGHVFTPYEILTSNSVVNVRNGSKKMGDPDPVLSLLESTFKVIVCDTIGNTGKRIYLSWIHYHEVKFSHLIADLLKQTPGTLPPFANANLDLSCTEQQDAFRMLAGPVTVLTGKGGCGKTWVVCQAFCDHTKTDHTNPVSGTGIKKQLFQSAVLFVAPTGKARSVIAKRTGNPAFTIHSACCRLTYSPGCFDTVTTLVVDEASMVELMLLSKLATKLPNLKRLILLGDTNQLQSIGPGNLLEDIKLAIPSEYKLELKVNHRTESADIIKNATLIQQRSLPKFGGAFSLIPERLNSVVFSRFGLQVKNHRTSQFIAFRNIDCEMLNKLCSSYYVHRDLTPNVFKSGDKVCLTRNLPLGNSMFINNGDIMFVTSRDMAGVTLEDESGKPVATLTNAQVREGKMTHAWARTIHTFQGSETNVIVYALGDNHSNISSHQTWSHVYTAVTRARKQVYILGTLSNLKKAIDKERVPRRTFLQERIKVAMLSNSLKRKRDSAILNIE